MLVNVYAGINRCDWIVEGLVQVIPKVDLKIPLIVRLSGTNVEEGIKIVKESGLPIILADTLKDAAQKSSRCCQTIIKGLIMSVLLNKNTKVLVQGITGRIGNFHAEEMIAYGTNVVAGVTPGKGGTTHLGKPVFNTVKEAVDATGAEATIVFVPAAAAADGIMEAADAGIKYAVSITDGIPAHDMIKVKRYLLRYEKKDRMIINWPKLWQVLLLQEKL